nr:phospholipid carrier-dependent glycosyltransferase [Corynebacterium sp. 13CS0277]
MTTTASRLPWTRLDWIVLGVLSLAALATRMVALGAATSEGTPVFDEKHYVPQAYDMVESTINPLTGGIESNPGYGLVVHPPLAKQLIALGEYLFGYSPWGWRLSVAIAGCLVVLLVFLLARELARSTWVGAVAGLLALTDGVLIVASRFGMLDIFTTLFVLLAVYALARDHADVTARVAAAQDVLYSSRLGPFLGFRWWRFLAGVALGCTLSVKWSGLYYMAFFGIYLVCHDYWLRRRALITHPARGVLLRDTLPNFLAVVIVPVAIYAWSWRAWFSSETSVYRHALAQGSIPENSALRQLPEALANWLYYHQSVLQFHASLTTSAGHHHPWESKPWTWLVAGRPILYLSDRDISCFGREDCDRLIYMFGTPTLWWLTVPVVGWALWAGIVRRRWGVVLPLVAFAAGFLPWVVGYDRQMYFFYATALVPFTVVLLAQLLQQLRRTRIGAAAVPVYLSLICVSFVYWLPIIYGIALPKAYIDSLLWLPSWK